jgi:hypothetical protein
MLMTCVTSGTVPPLTPPTGSFVYSSGIQPGVRVTPGVREDILGGT